MARKRKHPELELGPIITKAIVDYLGNYLGNPALNRMNSEQRASVIDIGTRVAREVELMLEQSSFTPCIDSYLGEENTKSKGEPST